MIKNIPNLNYFFSKSSIKDKNPFIINSKNIINIIDETKNRKFFLNIEEIESVKNLNLY